SRADPDIPTDGAARTWNPRRVAFSATIGSIFRLGCDRSWGKGNENPPRSSRGHRVIDCARACPRAGEGKIFRIAAAERGAEAEGRRGREGLQSRARQDPGTKIRSLGEHALGELRKLGRARSRRSLTPTHETHDRDDLVAAAGNGAERNGPLSLVRRNVVVRHRGPGRPLIRGAMNAEPSREAVQLVG